MPPFIYAPDPAFIELLTLSACLGLHPRWCEWETDLMSGRS
jgi:hypothetical protein